MLNLQSNKEESDIFEIRKETKNNDRIPNLRSDEENLLRSYSIKVKKLTNM